MYNFLARVKYYKTDKHPYELHVKEGVTAGPWKP
jgi:hypothetical protein